MDPINPATAGAGSAASSPQQLGAAEMVTSDFETFLKMMTEQLKHQDPLNPLDSNDFAMQLATFSGVEQQVQTNSLLTAIQSQLGAADATALAGWVGLEARAAVPADFDGTPLELVPRFATGAESARLVVQDPAGRIVQSLPLTVADGPVVWTGADANGAILPAGRYSFTVESETSGGETETHPAEVYAAVREARLDGERTLLVLAGGAEVPASEISAVRAADD